MNSTDFVRSYFDAWNRRDPERIAGHLSDDGVYRDVPENALRSQDELVDSLNKFFVRHRHRYELIGDVLYNDDTIAFQYRASSGNSYGSQSSTYHGAEFLTVDGDAARVITDYYDLPPEPRHRKYAKSGLDSERMQDYKRRLEQIMQTRQAYLQPNLTLPRLADMVGCSVNHLSQVINGGLGVTFFDYLNGYRVRHARELLNTLGESSEAVIEVAFAVGFNSNSAFYAAFKKFVGQTPAQYRQSNMKISNQEDDRHDYGTL
jgi:AraC-like DNA-binding protein